MASTLKKTLREAATPYTACNEQEELAFTTALMVLGPMPECNVNDPWPVWMKWFLWMNECEGYATREFNLRGGKQTDWAGRFIRWQGTTIPDFVGA